MHSKLEISLKDEQNKISFIGLSNWKLDAAKMNRAIFLAIPINSILFKTPFNLAFCLAISKAFLLISVAYIFTLGIFLAIEIAIAPTSST